MTPQPNKPRVLIVDDNRSNRIAFQSILEDDYSVRSAAGGHEALDLASKEEFAVILLDVRMPVMDGFDTAEALRALSRTWHTPIIFMSAYDQSLTQIKRGYVAGATDFISSPVDEDLLKFKVGAYVQLFLRNEALRLQVELLNTALRSLHAEFNRRNPTEDVLKSRIKELESLVDELQRQMSPAPL